jgi:D-alanyl-D-alanine dipeptidase
MYMNKPILQYIDLTTVPVYDNQEPLLEVERCLPDIVCEYQKQDMIPYVGNRFFLREGVVKRLQNAITMLKKENPGWRFKIVYAYRHPEVQTRYFEVRKNELRLSNPCLSKNELRDRAHLLSASPDVAGHPTGGAIDITIVDEMEKELDMGTSIADFSQGKKIWTFFPSISSETRENRWLLRRLLMREGFAPFDGEWWHFSYGDREWAKYYDKKEAIYDSIKLKLDDHSSLP